MRRKDNVFVRELDKDELRQLNRIKNSRNSELRERALIILHSYHGKTVPEIQKELLRARNTVLHWVRRFNEHGLQGLENRKPPGAKEKFTPEIRAKIAEIASADPRDLGLSHKAWSLSKLREHLIDQGVIDSISIESVRICLLKENVALKRGARKGRRRASVSPMGSRKVAS